MPKSRKHTRRQVVRASKPIKKRFVRFFTKSRLFADGYRVIDSDATPQEVDIPDLEVKSRNLSDLDFWIPDSAVGFIFFDIITAQVEDNGQSVELTSGEINKSGRYFFQIENCGRILTKDEAWEELERHVYARRYSLPPGPEKIILYPAEQYYAHGYSFSGGRRHHTRERKTHICIFDFFESDTAVPICWVFPHGHMIRVAAEKRGYAKKQHAA